MHSHKFIHLSDIHLMENYSNQSVSMLYGLTGRTPEDTFCQTMELIKKGYDDIEFILITGDLTSDSDEEQYQYIRNTLWNYFGKPIFVCPGNHDLIIPFRKVFNEFKGSGEYYGIHCHGEYDVVILDTMHDKSGIGRVSDRQLKWLASLENDGRNRIIAMHHPPYFSIEENELKYHVENAEQLYYTLINKNVMAVLCGHIHKAIAYKFGHIPVFTAGSTAFGAKFTREYMEFNNNLGFNICTIEGKQISVENVTVPVKEEQKVRLKYEI